MLLRLSVFFAFMAALWTCASVANARPPTGGWVVSFDDAQCLAFRDYGTREAPLQLILKVPPIGGVVQLAIARKGSDILASQVKATLAVDEHPSTRISMLTYSPKGSGLRVYSMNVPASEFALIRQAKALTIQGGGLEESLALTHICPPC